MESGRIHALGDQVRVLARHRRLPWRPAAVRWLAITVIALVLLGGGVPLVTGQDATPGGAAMPVTTPAEAAVALTALSAGPGVVFRAPENCVSDTPEASDPYGDPAVLAFCAVKDVYGALGGPSSGMAPADFVASPHRYEFSQPEDCAGVGAVADGRHDNCAVVTGAATLLREGLPVRLFGVCGQPQPKSCAVLGTITDPAWRSDGVYLLMDPARVTVHCLYAQDAGRNGCNAQGAYTAGQERPPCAENPTDPQCEYGVTELEDMLAAYIAYCTTDAGTCLENQIEARWDITSVIAIGYLNRTDQAWDCAAARTKAARFATAVNATWSTELPLVEVIIDVTRNQLRFTDAADQSPGCRTSAAPTPKN